MSPQHDKEKTLIMTANTAKIVDPKTGEERTVNVGFAQIYNAWWKVQRELIDAYPTALKVFTWLIDTADKRNALIVSYPAMAIAMELNKRTVMRAIAYLVKHKLITILKTGNMNCYHLNSQIIWKDTANLKDKYSKFSAEVFMVASEQEAAFRTELIGHAVQIPAKKARKAKKMSNSTEFE